MASSTSFADFEDFQHEEMREKYFLGNNDSQKDTTFLSPPLSPDHVENEVSLVMGMPLLHETIDTSLLSMDLLMRQTIDSDVFHDNPASDNVMMSMDPIIMESQKIPPLSMPDNFRWNTTSYEPRHSISGNTSTYTPIPSPPHTSRHDEEDDDESSSYMSRESSQLIGNSLSPSDVLAYGAAIPSDPKCHSAHQRMRPEVERQKHLSRTVERDECHFSACQRYIVASGQQSSYSGTLISK